jgi:hypothetical protein
MPQSGKGDHERSWKNVRNVQDRHKGDLRKGIRAIYIDGADILPCLAEIGMNDRQDPVKKMIIIRIIETEVTHEVPQRKQ